MVRHTGSQVFRINTLSAVDGRVILAVGNTLVSGVRMGPVFLCAFMTRRLSLLVRSIRFGGRLFFLRLASDLKMLLNKFVARRSNVTINLLVSSAVLLWVRLTFLMTTIIN